MKRRMLAWLLAIAMTAGLTACGGNSPSSTAGGTAAGTDTDNGGEPAALSSFAPPLSEEDQAIYAELDARSDNPDKIVWRHAEIGRNMDDSPQNRGNRQFFIEMKKMFGDRIEFQFFYNGSLASTTDQIVSGLQQGSFDSQGYNVASLAEYTNAFLPLDVMYLVPSLEAGIALSQGTAGQIMKEQCLADTDLIVLTMNPIGMRHITNSKKPIESLADLSGLKIRVQSNNLHISGFNALGASPTPMSYNEMFTALQQGTVDGQENPIANIYEANLNEIQSYMTLSNHLYTAGAFLVSEDFYNSLPEDIRAGVDACAAIAEAYAVEDIQYCENAELEELSKHMQVNELSPEAMEEFIAQAKTGWNDAAEYIGVEYFETIKAAIEADTGLNLD